jgi:hypothetical protein
MRFNWNATRPREFAFLATLLIVVLAGGIFTASNWYAKCKHLGHATDVRFSELGKTVRQDPAFSHVEFHAPNSGYKDSYHIRGTVASETDLDRLKALSKQYGFADVIEVKVGDGQKRANEQ